jgi:hypothetical protein
MKFKNHKIEELYEYMSDMAYRAYSDPYLISNDILCKQDRQGGVLQTYLTGKTPKRTTSLLIIKKILFYFGKNCVAVLLYLLSALAHYLSRQVFRMPEKGELLILDTYFVAREILKKGRFSDTYFPGLADALIRRKKNHVYVPRLFGTMNPLEWFRIFRILKENGDPVLTEFQLLKFADYLAIIQFIFLYPFSVLRFSKNLGSSYEDKVLNHSLWQTMDSKVFNGYARFLFGRRLSLVKIDKIKCLSWYENKFYEKNFYRGLRVVPGKVDIIGAQLYVKPSTLMNLVPSENETSFNVVPDRVLVNGSGYHFKSGCVPVDVGPSFRYAYLFNLDICPSDGEIVLIVMPMNDDVIRHILKVIREVDWPVPVEITFHSTTEVGEFMQDKSDRFSVANKKLPDLLARAQIVVGDCSGALVEAAALGIPVIDIKNPEEFSHDYMPETGKGILWDQAVGAREITQLVNQFQMSLQSHPSRLKEEGAQLRAAYFSEPTDKLIGRAFELD